MIINIISQRLAKPNKSRTYRRRSAIRLSSESLEQRQMLTTFTVTNLNGSGPGSLRDAIDQANATPGDDVVELDNSLIGTINLGGSELSITDSVEIQGNGFVAIDAEGQSRAIDVDDGDESTDANVTIRQLVIANGNSGSAQGGNIRNNERLTLVDSTVTGGNSENNGGGIATLNDLTIDNSSVDGNESLENGGGIYAGSYTNVEINNSNVFNNSGDKGGGINVANGSVTLNNSAVNDNAGADGGGIFADSGDIVMTNSQVTGNTAIAGNGGGVYVGKRPGEEGALLNATDSTINDNVAESGGAVHSDGGTVNLNNTTANNNLSSEDGGAINAVNGSEINIQQGTLNGNDAKTGGAIFGIDSTITIDDVTLSDNEATGTGGFSEGNGGAVALIQAILNAAGVNASGNSAFADGGAFAALYDSTMEFGGYIANIIQDNSATTGGGISADSTSIVTIANANVENNTATEDGGGFGVFGFNNFRSGGQPRGTDVLIRDTTIANNVSNDDGGGIYLGPNRVATINNTVISDNSANEGGGIYNRGTLSCDSCTIASNTSTTSGGGGGISLGNYPNSGTVSTATISGSIIENNEVSSSFGSGGGIKLDNYTSLIMDNSIVRGNSAGRRGGGITGAAQSDYTITNSTISGNSALQGGGLAARGAEGSMSNSTIANNVAEIGGGVYIQNINKVNSFDSVTLANNTATDQGGGLYVKSFGNTPTEIAFANSIVAGNSATNAGNDVFQDAPTPFDIQFDFSLIEDPAGAPIAGGDNLTGRDPLLGPLSNNGGPTPTMGLTEGSPALDAGDPALVAGQSSTPEFDQRGTGFTRVLNARIDMGAFEGTIGAPVVDGDFNDDGLFNGLDIDALVAEIAAGTNGGTFDLTGDGTVDLADRDAWLVEAGEINLGAGRVYLLGDANLDGSVDGNDFIAWNDNKFTPGNGWTGSDFNADGFTDGVDFLVWNDNKFQTADDDQEE